MGGQPCPWEEPWSWAGWTWGSCSVCSENGMKDLIWLEQGLKKKKGISNLLKRQRNAWKWDGAVACFGKKRALPWMLGWTLCACGWVGAACVMLMAASGAGCVACSGSPRLYLSSFAWGVFLHLFILSWEHMDASSRADEQADEWVRCSENNPWVL